jgi:hypothetical protein
MPFKGVRGGGELDGAAGGEGDELDGLAAVVADEAYLGEGLGEDLHLEDAAVVDHGVDAVGAAAGGRGTCRRQEPSPFYPSLV